MKIHDGFGLNATSCFGFPTTDKLAKELDDLLAVSPDYEYFKSNGHTQYFIDGEKADVSVITDDTVDADNEVVDLKSMDLTPLKERQFVAYNHNYSIPPIGKSIWQKLTGNKIIAKTLYAVTPPAGVSLDKWFPNTIFHLIKNGFLPGKSIGGVAKKVAPTAEEIAANPVLKDVKFIRKNAKVYEYSVTPIQANKNAIVQAVSKGEIQIGPELCGEWPELEEVYKQIQKSKEPIRIGKAVTVEEYQEEISKNLITSLNRLELDILDKVQARVLGRV